MGKIRKVTRFEDVFDTNTQKAGLSFVKEEKPVVGVIEPRFVNRKGAVHIQLRESADPETDVQLSQIFLRSLKDYKKYTTTYAEVATGRNQANEIDLLQVPSLRRLIHALGSRAALQAVQINPQEEVILDYPVRELDSGEADPHRRVFTDQDTLIG